MATNLFETPTTELQAVNQMLRGIGEQSFNTLANATTVEANIAKKLLGTVNREVQTHGWDFNTEEDYTLSIDVSNNFILPANTLKMKPGSTSIGRNIATRGNGSQLMVYDKTNNTFTFTGVSELKVDLVLLIEFESIPQAARNYIAMRATRQFQDNMQGDENDYTIKKTDELMAKAMMDDDEAEAADHNILTGTWNMFETTMHGRRS